VIAIINHQLSIQSSIIYQPQQKQLTKQKNIMKTKQEQIQEIEKDWLENPRWNGVKRPYTAEDVLKLRGSYKLDYTIATEMSKKFWNKLNTQDLLQDLVR
jgi:hypothetical protein